MRLVPEIVTEVIGYSINSGNQHLGVYRSFPSLHDIVFITKVIRILRFPSIHDIVFITKVIRILRLSKQVVNQPYL